MAAREDVEQRAARAEAALAEAIAERNRLWDELHHRKANDDELEHYKTIVTQMVSSRSWRITAPLRAMMWFLAQLPELARKLRRFLAHRPRVK
ncbi:MAG: hypothetical protein WBB74_06565 [Gaiellaceae bacterium]